MNIDRITELINKLPLTLFLVAYLGFLGSDYYSFMHDESSPLAMKHKEIEAAKQGSQKAQAKLKEIDTFVKSLEKKKVEIRQLALELQETKNSIPERSDVPGFMKATITEAKKVGIVITALKPGITENHEFYSEQHYEMKFRGAYVQVLGFLDRISNMNEIVQVDSFGMKPTGSQLEKIVALEGSLDVKTFSYLGTKEDKIGHSENYDSASGSGDKSTPKSSSPTGTGSAPGGGK